MGFLYHGLWHLARRDWTLGQRQTLSSSTADFALESLSTFWWNRRLQVVESSLSGHVVFVNQKAALPSSQDSLKSLVSWALCPCWVPALMKLAAMGYLSLCSSLGSTLTRNHNATF